MANVLVLGSGGREHALCYRLSKSPSVKNVYCAPGSYGMKDVAQAVPIDIFDHDIVIKAAEYLKVDLVLVGPETVLDAGITDSLEEAGIKVFGPNKKATQLESSKEKSHSERISFVNSGNSALLQAENAICAPAALAILQPSFISSTTKTSSGFS